MFGSLNWGDQTWADLGGIMEDHFGNEARWDRGQAAAYVAELTTELAAVARRHGLDVLGYLLDMARLEAENVVHRPKSTGSKAKTARG